MESSQIRDAVVLFAAAVAIHLLYKTSVTRPGGLYLEALTLCFAS
jgi:hypothetical protein